MQCFWWGAGISAVLCGSACNSCYQEGCNGQQLYSEGQHTQYFYYEKISQVTILLPNLLYKRACEVLEGWVSLSSFPFLCTLTASHLIAGVPIVELQSSWLLSFLAAHSHHPSFPISWKPHPPLSARQWFSLGQMQERSMAGLLVTLPVPPCCCRVWREVPVVKCWAGPALRMHVWSRTRLHQAEWLRAGCRNSILDPMVTLTPGNSWVLIWDCACVESECYCGICV